MRPRTLFLAGLVLGAFLGLLVLVGGTLVLVPGLFVWAYLMARRPRFASASGGLIGFGAAWLLLLGQAGWRCASDPSCSQPDLTPWLAFAAALVAAGGVLGLLGLRRNKSRVSVAA
jgi:hypothetical protein